MISKNISGKVILFAEKIAEQNEKLAAHAEDPYYHAETGGKTFYLNNRIKIDATTIVTFMQKHTQATPSYLLHESLFALPAQGIGGARGACTGAKRRYGAGRRNPGKPGFCKAEMRPFANLKFKSCYFVLTA